MKREIKFRVWTGIDMEYSVMAGIYGVFYANPENGNGLNPQDSASLTVNMTIYHGDVPVMQYTGLKDLNGKEIYEGDIIYAYGQFEVPCSDKKDFEIIKYEHKGIISFDNGCFIFKQILSKEKLLELQKTFGDPSMDTDIESSLDSFLGIQILGNIYQNPELL